MNEIQADGAHTNRVAEGIYVCVMHISFVLISRKYQKSKFFAKLEILIFRENFYFFDFDPKNTPWGNFCQKSRSPQIH